MNSGHSSRSFSSVAASVERPVFVRLVELSPAPRRGSGAAGWAS